MLHRHTGVALVGLGLVALGGSDARAGKASDLHAVKSPFQLMDTNADGKVSAEEHSAGAKKMFETMDANRDSSVTAAEMEAAQEVITGKRPGQTKATELSAAEKIKVVDANGDGTLSAGEHATASKTMFEKMDTNRDGFLSKAEMDAGHAKMMSKTMSTPTPAHK